MGILLAAQPAQAEGPEPPPPGWLLYDGGLLLAPDDYPPNSMPVELALQLFTTGSPPVKWRTSAIPTIEVCTFQGNRPAWVTADQFREAVIRAIDLWSEAEAAIGVVYGGDCPSGSTWVTNNSRNEIGWDDGRNFVRSPAVAVTQGTWTVTGGRRDFVEADIVIENTLQLPGACFESTVAHELGHALGLGHSDTFGDLMYPEFDSNNAATCALTPSAAETEVLRLLYGINRRPTITATEAALFAGQDSTLSVTASDPDGDALTYEWLQVEGPRTEILSQSSNSIMVDVPEAPGATVEFEVRVLDHYRHVATASITAMIGEDTQTPSGTPSLGSLRPSDSGTNMTLAWSENPNATEYRFCTTPTGTTSTTCRTQQTPRVDVTWDAVLGPAVPGETVRVLTSGTRETSMAACNRTGCTDPGAGPHAGGLRWAAHQVSYDYFAMSFDVPGTKIRFTIAGVVNVSGPARKFTLYSGTQTDFVAKRILNCGNVAVGRMCLGLLGPGDSGHNPFVTIRSERTSTPMIEHRIRVR